MSAMPAVQDVQPCPLKEPSFRTVRAERPTVRVTINGEKLMLENLQNCLMDDAVRQEELWAELEHVQIVQALRLQLVALARELVTEEEQWRRKRLGTT